MTWMENRMVTSVTIPIWLFVFRHFFSGPYIFEEFHCPSSGEHRDLEPWP